MTRNSKINPIDTPASKINLTREANNDIRKMIFLNELRPGQKVAYRDMARRLGKSLKPVVQVLKHMEFLGLLQHEPNRGFYNSTSLIWTSAPSMAVGSKWNSAK